MSWTLRLNNYCYSKVGLHRRKSDFWIDVFCQKKKKKIQTNNFFQNFHPQNFVQSSRRNWSKPIQGPKYLENSKKRNFCICLCKYLFITICMLHLCLLQKKKLKCSRYIFIFATRKAYKQQTVVQFYLDSVASELQTFAWNKGNSILEPFNTWNRITYQKKKRNLFCFMEILS